MRTTITFLLFLGAVIAAQAQAYPVQGRWGQSASSEKGAIDCANKRVIEFIGNQRTDSNGGVGFPQSIGGAGRAVELSDRR